MTSVPSHLLRLSGNRYFFLLLSLTLLLSCAAKKQVTNQRPVQIIKGDTKPKVDPDQNGNVDKQIKPNPNIDNTPIITKVDTIKWREDKSKDPITIIDTPTKKGGEGSNFKEAYNVKLLIPLGANKANEAEFEKSRFIHFYAGVLRALEKLDDEGIKFNVTVIDTDTNTSKATDRIDEILNPDTDLIIGPNDKDDIKVFAEQCKERSIPLVSPWQTSTKTTTENPYYIQMKPNLKEHYLRLVQSATRNFSAGEVTIVGRNNKETKSWITYLQLLAENTTGKKGKPFFDTHYISQDSATFGIAIYASVLNSPKIKAILLPQYSYNDEDYVYNCLRKLIAEKGNKNIIVYGMPLIYESERIEFDFYRALNMRLVVSDFLDENSEEIKYFRRKYLDFYGYIPTVDAIKGYDMMLYIGRNLWKYGKNFQFQLENEPSTYLSSNYAIKKSMSDENGENTDPEKFDYFENKHLDIIEFKESKFVVRRQ